MGENGGMDNNETVDEAVEAVQVRQGSFHAWFQLLLINHDKIS